MSAVTCIAPPRQVPLTVTQSNCRAALGAPRPGSVHPGEQPRVHAGVRQGFFMLRLYFLCANPTLARNSAVALTLRAVGGLTSRQIATAYLVTEATMARWISRPSGGSRGCRSTSPAISGRCCACSTSSSMRGTAETSTWRPRRSASPVPHPAALQPVSRPSLNYFAFRDSFGSSGCMVSSCDLGGDDSGGRGGGDRCAWSGTGQPAALPDRAAVTATRPRSGGRASARRPLAGAAVPGLWRPGAGSRSARGGRSRPA
jgi:hypothetical protein